MARIKIIPDALMRGGSELGKRIEELEELNRELNRLLSDIEGSWSGAAAAAYIKKMTTYQEKSSQMREVLTVFQSYAERTAKRFETKDREWAKKIRNC